MSEAYKFNPYEETDAHVHNVPFKFVYININHDEHPYEILLENLNRLATQS